MADSDLAEVVGGLAAGLIEGAGAVFGIGGALLLLGVVLGLMLVLMVLDDSHSQGKPDLKPEQEAAEWARDLGFRDAHIKCVALDTDDDGYISCSVATSKPDGAVTVQAVECASTSSGNSGCRIPKPSVQATP